MREALALGLPARRDQLVPAHHDSVKELMQPGLVTC